MFATISYNSVIITYCSTSIGRRGTILFCYLKLQKKILEKGAAENFVQFDNMLVHLNIGQNSATKRLRAK